MNVNEVLSLISIYIYRACINLVFVMSINLMGEFSFSSNSLIFPLKNRISNELSVKNFLMISLASVSNL